jgi:FKBP-type peptidyl-prolyl cis-trans isomerase FkpA
MLEANLLRKDPAMRKHLLLSCAIVLATVAGASGAGPALETDDQKTLYALGVVISRSLGPFALDAADLEAVKAGLTDGVLGEPSRVELETWGPKIQELAEARSTAAAANERKAGEAFQKKAAGEQGATRTSSGLVISTITAGRGASPKADDRVKVHYHGTLTDGSVFDSSVERGEPATFHVGGVIPCFGEALQRMKVGGKSRLVCPPDLAYGDRGAPPRIRPGATLVFEVELLEIVTP